MHTPHTRTLALASPEQTCAAAQTLAPFLVAGDVVLLTGDIGAGKTHFARCMIQSLLAIPEDVPSPTFTLVQTYPGREAEIWHADLYRLTDTNEVFELGLIDAFESAICLIEWPDRLGDLAPESALHITLSPAVEPDARMMTLEWQNPVWTRRIAAALER